MTTNEDFFWNQLTDEQVCQKFVDAAEEMLRVRDRLEWRGIEVQDVDLIELLTSASARFCEAGEPRRRTRISGIKFAKLICPAGRR